MAEDSYPVVACVAVVACVERESEARRSPRRHHPEHRWHWGRQHKRRGWTKSLRWATGLALLLGVLPSAWTAADSLVGPDKAAVGDPVGDVLDTTGEPIDITRLVAERRDGDMHLELQFAGTVSAPDSGRDDALFGFIDIDTDQQASTGELALVDYLSDFESGLGSDALVDLATYSSVDRKVDVVAASGGQVLGRVAMDLSADRLSLDVPLILIGGDGAISTSAVVGNSKVITDVAPDGGFLATVAGGGEVLLSGGRFAVDVSWQDFSGASGAGTLVFQSDDSAVFWFFDANNWELMVKVINGCAFNDRFWVFSAATTNVEFNVRITDTVSGVVKSYPNALGESARAVTDTDAFATCGTGGA